LPKATVAEFVPAIDLLPEEVDQQP
jgi:hypothetical protein